MKISCYGEYGLLIQWEEKIDPQINRQVHQLDRLIRETKLPELSYTVPAYCSLTLVFDRADFDRDQVSETIQNLYEKTHSTSVAPGRKLRIPVCYERSYALDQNAVCKETGLSWNTFTQKHHQTSYQVYMLGFLPGFAYLGKLEEALQMPRKKQPRQRVPAGSVAITGLQTAVYPAEVPGGWQIIGRSPVPAFYPGREDPFLFAPGDQVSFFPISAQRFLDIEEDIQKDQFDWRHLYA